MKIKSFLQLAVIILIIVGGYFGIRYFSTPEVVVATVYRGNAILSATGNVTVIPKLDSRMVASRQAILLKFPYKEGDLVKKGDIVAKLDPGQLPFTLRNLENDLEKLEKQMSRGSSEQFLFDAVKDELEKIKKLYEAGNISENAVRDVETRYNGMKFKMLSEQIDYEYARKRLQNQIDEVQDQLDRLELKAPFDGVIMAPAVLEGDLVFSGNTIGKVTSVDKSIMVEINQDDLPAVRRSKRVSVNFFSFPEKDYEGSVNYLIPVGNSSTQRFTVFLKMKEIPVQLLSGQTGEAVFVADEHPNTLLIPRSAMFGDTVFVVKDGIVEQRKIKTGLLSITTAEVLEGLKEGEFVISKDVDLQRDGERVKVKEKEKK
ncbi:MAG: efflux RND transporter periplasmic adaptor subunit [Puniceicoccales bacterium]|jgi:RND family efflux transporter MFP subunit|nr:efflux RND transporter periplasmic adaptor subunit [Puniceicoccales bacterium]